MQNHQTPPRSARWLAPILNAVKVMASHGFFRNREDAGTKLAARLTEYGHASPLVLGLARGGVPVAFEIARALRAPLDVWIVRKVGAPAEPELGMGAVSEGGEVLIDPRTVALVGASTEEVEALVAQKTSEVERRCRQYRGARPAPDVRGRTVILVDDGIATGGTARAALRALRRRGPKKLVLATPVAAEEAVLALRDEADAVVCLAPVPDLFAIGLYYDDFSPTSDEQVIALLDEATFARAPEDAAHPVSIRTADAVLGADLALPRGAQALVLFAHGSGSSRRSPRNRCVAERLVRAGIGTLLFDLLTPEEEAVDSEDAHLRFDIGFLAHRLVGATDWARNSELTRGLRIGYFGASTGAAAALVAAAARPNVVQAVVSRGGRPDLAESALGLVGAPTLLIVGGRDREVLQLNRDAIARINAPKQLEVVPGATHLFEEPGALERVAHLAAQWFVEYLVPLQVSAHA